MSRVPRSERGGLARYLAPAAFLLAATIALLLIRAALHEDDPAGPGTARVVTTRAATTTGSTTTETTATIATTAPEFHTIVSGDTFQQLALDNDTTVEELVRLNPGVDPAALSVGQKVRIR